MAFVGVEFCTEADDDGSLAIVLSKWLTPQKQEIPHGHLLKHRTILINY